MPAIRGAVLDQIGVPRPYWRSKPISVVELHLDPPDRGEVLVRIEAAGVCHSDLSVVDGTRVRPVPILLGHEAAGIVEQVGDGADGPAAVSKEPPQMNCTGLAKLGIDNRPLRVPCAGS